MATYTTLDLTTQVTIPNGQKLDFSRPDFNDDLSECKFSVTLRTGTTQAQICRWDMTIRDGISDMAARQTVAAVGLNVEDTTRWIIQTTRTTATGYTDLLNAWRAANTSATRKAAFKATLLSAGHIDATLTGN